MLSDDERIEREVRIPADKVELEGALVIPMGAPGIVLFAHGSGSSRFSPRNHFVAKVLQQHRFATLLMDLLTTTEDRVYETRFDIGLLTRRLAAVARWVEQQSSARELPLGLFGASTGAASALRLAAELGDGVAAVVSRGGRPDLAAESLSQVTAPTLLLVGGRDEAVLDLNQQAQERLRCTKQLVVIPDATHLFEEPGALEAVADKAAEWFMKYLTPVETTASLSKAHERGDE